MSKQITLQREKSYVNFWWNNQKIDMKIILYKIGQVISAISTSVIILLTVIDVALRYFLNKSIFGSAELTNMLLAIVVGAGLIVVSRDRLHITVDLFRPQLTKYFGTGYSKWVKGWEMAGTIGLVVLLGRHGWHTLKANELTPVLEFPIGWVYLLTAVLVAIAVWVMILQVNEINEPEAERLE